MSKALQKKQIEAEGKRRLDTEVLHQREEATTSALGRAMMSDAANNRSSLNNSALKLLNNFQG